MLLPVFVRLISKEGMGHFILYQTMFQVFLPVITLSLQNSIVINYYQYTKEQFERYFAIVCFFFLAVYILFASSALLAQETLSQWTELPAWGLRMILIIIFFEFFTELRKSLWRIQRKPKLFGVFLVTLTFLKNGLGIILVYYFNFGWEGIVIGHLIGYILMAVVSLILFYNERLLVPEFSNFKRDIKDALTISGPISVHRLSAWLGTSLNRVIIANKIGSQATASFGIGSTFFMICNVLFDALNKAYVPALYEKLKNINEAVKSSLLRLTFFYYLIILVITIIFSIGGYFTVGIIFGEAYESTKDFIIPLTLAAGFNGLYKIHVNYIFYTKKTYLVTSITFFLGLINIPLSLIMIINYNLIGAAYALLLINILYYLFALTISNKLIPLSPFKNVKNELTS